MFLGDKKCRIYAACSVSQTPNYKFKRKEIMTNEKNNMYVSNFIAIGVYCWV